MIQQYKYDGLEYESYAKTMTGKPMLKLKFNSDQVILENPNQMLIISLEINPAELIHNTQRHIATFTLNQLTDSFSIIQNSLNCIGFRAPGTLLNGKYQIIPDQWNTIEICISDSSFSLKINNKEDINLGSSFSQENLKSVIVQLGGDIDQVDHICMFRGSIRNLHLLSEPTPIPTVATNPSFVYHSSTSNHFSNFEDVNHYEPALYESSKLNFPLALRKQNKSQRMVIACHDTDVEEDKLIFGNKNHQFLFKFNNWHNIDIFIFFGHYAVVIPPPAYIRVAHMNGVKILGTIVCEGNRGADEIKNILSGAFVEGTSQTSIKRYGDQLAQIAKDFGFDGYLLNIECQISQQQMPQLYQFIQYLRAKLKEHNKNSLLLWYDSVTHSGALRWQSCLNQNNSNFFNITDGFFTDYHWGPVNLSLSTQCAQNRSFNVFFGNDVYGRGTYGGGMLNTYIAVNVFTLCRKFTSTAFQWHYLGLVISIKMITAAKVL